MLSRNLTHIQVLAIVCSQWGDSGKGKLVDHFAEWADFIVRGTGGANAGHTICTEGQQFILHLVPCGILYPNKVNIIGNGVAIDPEMLYGEICMMSKEGYECKNLFIASNAKLVLLPHRVLDMVRELCKGRVGSTGKGMGPVYEAHVGRKGFTVNDLLESATFADKLESNLTEMVMLLKAYQQKLSDQYGTDVIRKIMEELGHVDFYHEEDIFDFAKIAEFYLKLGSKIAPMVTNTDRMVKEALTGDKKILLEGAQGTLLSIDYGTYPFVTSSDSTIHGLAKGAGLSVGDVDHTILVVKAPYMTRVGNGPFPTEMGGNQSEEWCRNNDKSVETDKFGHLAFSNVSDEFELGICIRDIGGETGATTGRLRRVGWLDLVSARYAMEVNCTKSVALTKLDVLAGCSKIKVCVAYCYKGPYFHYGNQTIWTNEKITDFIPAAEFLQHCEPIYKEFDGYGDISQIKSWGDISNHKSLDIFLKFLEEQGFVIDLISIGPDRTQTILR